MNEPTTSPRDTDSPDAGGQPFLTHEKSLTQKIAKGSEAGDILDQQILMLGIQLVTQLNALIKTSRIHGRTNAALDKPVEGMLTLIKTLAHSAAVVLRLQNDFLFIGDQHLKVSAQQMAVFSSVIDSLNAWKVGGIAFSNEVQSKDIREFAHVFVTGDPASQTLQDLRKDLQGQGVNGIELEDPKFLNPAGVKQQKAIAKNSYLSAAGAVGNLTQQAREGGTVGFKQAKRAIQNIVDLLAQDQATLLGLTTLRCHDEYTHNHSVNVALLSMALGNRAGYSKVDLADLGLGALFHDVGKCAISLDVLNKPGEFTKEEWETMRTHPTEGVLTLVKLRGIHHVPDRMAGVSFEHHMNYDFSGYPKLAVEWKQSVASRIVTIADCYDAMTSSRVYRREPLTPSKVLQFMFSKRGQSFDPILLKLFVNCVGIVPIGSLVLLDSNQLAVVVRPAQDKGNAERPIVRIVADSSGNPVDDSPEVDLAEKRDDGEYRFSIVQLVDNAAYKFDTSRYFV